MNFRAMINQLVEIQENPNEESVTITVSGNTTTYTLLDQYYFPAGIARISIVRGGAGVVYVYTTSENDPHLTIPDSGENIHWTEDGERSENWPDSVSNFLALYP